ncbi:carbohydrate ABC transporter permease [Desnuesiella massiliensis]|uniref:carbohydrate ABC transporter permease n=1 Tax=Desnuesiella massiliensis TaxID=1650662 RepID=UPI0006E1B9F7|nr:carbohydrate ABC transporter permease [Desnuesiella massiliensis]
MEKTTSKGFKSSNIANGIVGVILGLLFLSPFYVILINSFKTKKELFEDTLSFPKVWSFANYKEAFKQLDFFRALGNSLFITVTSIIVIIVFSSMAAWMLERTKTKTSTFIFYLFVSSMLVPFQSVMLPLVRLMGKLRLLNMGGIIFMYLGFGAAMSIFLYHGFVKGIPKELDEAAMIDGCTKFQTFWHIIFPLLKPITITVAILNTVWIWNDFLLPSLVINKPSTQTIPLKTFFFFGQYTKQWHLALAGLVLTIIPVIIFYFSAQKHIIKSIAAGSIK